MLVNDGSRDGSWDVIAERARRSPHVVALDLLRNYGQHHANLAGLRESTGDFVITMDDDLQNPPDQVLLLIDKALEGHDVVFGRFERKQARGYRRLGSRMINVINRRVFEQPPASPSPTSGSCAATWWSGSAGPAPRTPTSPARR